MSFLESHKAQHNPVAPNRSKVLCFCPYCLNQRSKRSPAFNGGTIPNDIWTTRHRNFAYWHSKKRFCIVSFLPQKAYDLSPCQFCLLRLFFVSNTPFFRYQIKILIFKGNLVRQMSCGTKTLLLKRYLYIDRIEKDPFL